MGRSLTFDADPLIICTDIAVPLALIMNELVTNAIQHSRAVEAGGRVHVVLQNTTENFSIRVSDPGNGPDGDAQPTGLGTKIVEAWHSKSTLRSQRGVCRQLCSHRNHSPPRENGSQMKSREQWRLWANEEFEEAIGSTGGSRGDKCGGV